MRKRAQERVEHMSDNEYDSEADSEYEPEPEPECELKKRERREMEERDYNMAIWINRWCGYGIHRT